MRPDDGHELRATTTTTAAELIRARTRAAMAVKRAQRPAVTAFGVATRLEQVAQMLK